MDFIYTPFGGILGVIHIVAFIWALLSILGSSMSGVHKILWLVIVGLLPVFGLIAYILVRKKA